MRKMLVLLGVAAVAVLLATTASAANRGVTFTGIGFIENPGPQPASSIWDMTPDGTVFLVSPTPYGTYMAKWTRENGWGDLVGNISGTIRIAADGTVMGNGIYPGSNPAYAWAGTWTGVTDVWDPLPAQPGYAPCGSSRLAFLDMGGNGNYATGLTWSGCSIARAFKWDKATNTTVDLGTPNSKSTRGNAITADGSKVIGWGTALWGGRRAARFENGTIAFLGDPNGLEPKNCAASRKGCTSNSADALNGCPGEYVDDGYCTNRGTCQNKGTCVSNVCVGGSNPGTSCTSNSQCRGACVGGSNPGTQCTSDSTCAGTCVGPNAGANCTSNGACPDTQVCVANSDWNDSLWKGEAYDVTDDGAYACGRNFDYGAKWNSGFRANPDGTFTEIAPPDTWPYLTDPFRISQDGKTLVGRSGDYFSGTVPIFWREGIGTVDLQLFLVAQGLDELYFWYLVQANAVSADGTVIAGYGYNPDGWMEGFIVDMKKVWICHMPPGHPENQRTLGIEIGSAADHLAHGDFLGTCEFMNSGALSRAADERAARMTEQNASFSTMTPGGASESWSPWSPAQPKSTIRERGARPDRSRGPKVR